MDLETLNLLFKEANRNYSLSQDKYDSSSGTEDDAMEAERWFQTALWLANKIVEIEK